MIKRKDLPPDAICKEMRQLAWLIAAEGAQEAHAGLAGQIEAYDALVDLAKNYLMPAHLADWDFACNESCSSAGQRAQWLMNYMFD